MSRVARKPIEIPKGIEVNIAGQKLAVKGPKGALEVTLHGDVVANKQESVLSFEPRQKTQNGFAQAGTARALVANMVNGVAKGFEKKLQLVGVGYRAQAQGKALNLTLGFSHPVVFQVPTGITIETPSQTEILIKGVDKQLVGQVAANIRGYRPPEPYKGKGVRYSDEAIILKEAKKK